MAQFDTENMESDGFPSHGRVSFELLSPSIILYTAEGPFNQEVLEALGKLEEQALAPFKASKKVWSEVVTFKKSCMMSQEQVEALCSYLIQMKADGYAPFYSAYVFDNSVEGASIMPEKFKNIYEAAEIPFAAFNHVDAAVRWLQEVQKN